MSAISFFDNKSIDEILSKEYEWDNIMLSHPIVSTQFITPIKIAKLMVKIGNLFPHKKVLDPACGIGTILIQCAKFYPNSKIIGWDINNVIVNESRELIKGLELSNRIIVYVGDSLTHKFKEKYDLVISHFPFGLTPGRGLEFGFIGKSLSILRKNGTLICIVPGRVLGSNYYLPLRRKIINEFSLELVINLPRNYMPNVFVNTSILIIRKKLPRKNVMLTTYQDNDDDIIKKYQSGLGSLMVPFHKMLDRWDTTYHGPKYKSIESDLEKHRIIKSLYEIGTIIRGLRISKENTGLSGQYLVLSGKNIVNNRFKKTKYDKYTERIPSRNFLKCIAQRGDIIIPLIFRDGKILYYNETMPLAVVSHDCVIIRSPNNDYLQTYLKSEKGQEIFKKQVNRILSGTVARSLTVRDLESIKIPIIPIDNLNDVGEESLSSRSEKEIIEIIQRLKKIQTLPGTPIQDVNIFIQNSKRQQKIRKLLDIIRSGESKTVEFKSSLRTPLKKDYSKIPKDKRMPLSLQKNVENSTIKAICALCNSEGGYLFIGVSDRGEIIGIENDKFNSWDNFQLHLKNLIRDRITPSITHCVDWELITPSNEKPFCLVTCKESKVEVFFKEKGKEPEFYVRQGASSQRLNPIDMLIYLREKKKKPY